MHCVWCYVLRRIQWMHGCMHKVHDCWPAYSLSLIHTPVYIIFNLLLAVQVEGAMCFQRWNVSRRDSQTTQSCYHSHRFIRLPAKNGKWNGKCRLAGTCTFQPPSQSSLVCTYSRGYDWLKGNSPADRLARSIGITSRFLSREIWSVDELETLPAVTNY